MNRHVALAATMRFSHVFPLVAVAALLAACGDEGTDPSNSPSNTAPTAAFAAQCNPLTCTFANSTPIPTAPSRATTGTSATTAPM